MTILAYTYDADYHCIDCTRKRFDLGGFDGKWNQLDREGNLIHPLFATDEWQEVDPSFLEENPIQFLTCGDCHAVIDQYDHQS